MTLLEQILEQVKFNIIAMDWAAEVHDKSVNTYSMLNDVLGLYIEGNCLEDIDDLTYVEYGKCLRLGMEEITSFVEQIEEKSAEETMRFANDLNAFLDAQTSFLDRVVVPDLERFKAA